MNIDNKQIYLNFRRYYRTASLSGEEDQLADVLLADYPWSHKHPQSGAVVWPGDPLSDLCFIVHMDRIPVQAVDFVFQEDGSLPIIGGQLDNTISLAVLRTIYNLGYRFNAIFTTEEESCNAHRAVVDIAHLNRWTVIDCDIDVFSRGDEWINSISLRQGDNIARYTPWLVYDFQRLAEGAGINYSSKTDWLVGTIGFVRRQAPDIDGLYLGLPILNYHSGREFASLESVNAYARLISLAIEEFSDGKESAHKWGHRPGRELSDRALVGERV